MKNEPEAIDSLLFEENKEQDIISLPNAPKSIPKPLSVHPRITGDMMVVGQGYSDQPTHKK